MNDEEHGAWKTVTYLTGAAVGLVMGLAAAHMYARTAEESGEAGTPVRIETGDALKNRYGSSGAGASGLIARQQKTDDYR